MWQCDKLAAVHPDTPLAFVDVETTGLSPRANRVAEIGVITVDRDRLERWTALVGPTRERLRTAASNIDAPNVARSFGQIAAELAQRLSGRLIVAHNARFDYAFLRAEFERVGVAFNPELLCSVMLSRQLYPGLAHHDLDSLAEHHQLRVETRHRALPDADLIWQLWRVIQRERPAAVISDAINRLLAGPVLPPHLDPSLIERLPESPGAYVFHGERNAPLFVGAAGNLRLQIRGYFRTDRATGKALEYSHRVTNITWRATRGMLGARLQAAALDNVLFANTKRRMRAAAFTWGLSPAAVPSVAIVAVSDGCLPRSESFGLFPSERKARNALVRLATKHRLCHCLLGVSGFASVACPACPVDQPSCACGTMVDRKKQLLRLFAALQPLRIAAWPHRGPIGIRERSDLHVVDHWQFLGTAQNDSEVHELLESRPGGFDRRLYLLLNRTCSRLPPRKIVDLSQYARSADCSAAIPAQGGA